MTILRSSGFVFGSAGGPMDVDGRKTSVSVSRCVSRREDRQAREGRVSGRQRKQE